MKILITNPGLHYSHGHKFVQQDWPSLTLPYLAGILSKHNVRILDNSHVWKPQIIKAALDFMPDLVVFSIIAGRDVPAALKEIRQLQDFGFKVLAGGQGAALNQDKMVGIPVINDEGERALPRYVETGEIITFPRIALDASPLPDWKKAGKVKSLTFPTYTGAMEMSRGCPHHCDFCAINQFWHSYRRKSIGRIIEELIFLSLFDRRHIYLSDDNFGVGTNFHMNLFDEILARNIKVKLFTQIRADTVAQNPEMIKAAAKAGLYGVLVGFDSYDNDVLDENAKTTSAETNNKAAEVLRKNKILIYGSHIYGLPGQKSFEKTFNMGRKNSDIFAMPYFDGRPKIERPGYDPEYVKYVHREQFSLKSVLGLVHPNKAIRVLKRGCLSRYWNCTLGYERERDDTKRVG